jgi:hypothetical protein
MPDVLVDFITSLDGYAAAEGWPGCCGLQGPEYLVARRAARSGLQHLAPASAAAQNGSIAFRARYSSSAPRAGSERSRLESAGLSALLGCPRSPASLAQLNGCATRYSPT